MQRWLFNDSIKPSYIYYTVRTYLIRQGYIKNVYDVVNTPRKKVKNKIRRVKVQRILIIVTSNVWQGVKINN